MEYLKTSNIWSIDKNKKGILLFVLLLILSVIFCGLEKKNLTYSFSVFANQPPENKPRQLAIIPHYKLFKDHVCEEFKLKEKKCVDEFLEFSKLTIELDEYFEEMITKLNQSYLNY